MYFNILSLCIEAFKLSIELIKAPFFTTCPIWLFLIQFHHLATHPFLIGFFSIIIFIDFNSHCYLINFLDYSVRLALRVYFQFYFVSRIFS